MRIGDAVRGGEESEKFTAIGHRSRFQANINRARSLISNQFRSAGQKFAFCVTRVCIYKCERRSSPSMRELIFMAKVGSVYRLRRPLLSGAIKFVEFSATEPSVCIYGDGRKRKGFCGAGIRRRARGDWNFINRLAAPQNTRSEFSGCTRGAFLKTPQSALTKAKRDRRHAKLVKSDALIAGNWINLRRARPRILTQTEICFARN